MATESDFGVGQELRRKSLHLAMIVVPLGVVVLPSRWPGVIYSGTAVALVLDALRLRNATFQRHFDHLLGRFARVHERRGLLGVTWFLVASTLSLALFSPDIAVAALLFVVVGDAAAALVGRRWGRWRWRGKSLEGSIACFLSCLAAAGWWIDDPRMLLVGALTATVVEFLPIPLDDNLRVPLSSALAMSLARL